MTEEIGRTYAGRYRIEGELGRGGMAIVYLAFDSRMKRRVALKVLYPHLALRDEHKVRFQREAEVVANLNHRNIVRIHDYSGTESEDNFIVAEYVEGTTLKRFTAENPLVLPEVGAMMAHEIAGALDHAHRNHVIHRDVKPENVMFDSQGVLKLMDFGIAQIKDVQQMTVTGQMIGSPAHMSPEHIEGRNLDHRSDIFSLGTVLYLLCVGELPFKGATAHALFKRILDVDYVPAVQASPAVGEDLSAIIDRCLRKEMDERYQSCAELQLALASHLRSLGFDLPSAELADFFKAPRQYQLDGRNRVIDRLLQSARQLVAARRLGEAMRCFDRALCLDESRTDVVQELERLQRRVELKRLLMRRLLPALTCLAITAAVGWLWVSGTLDLVLGSSAPSGEVAEGPPPAGPGKSDGGTPLGPPHDEATSGADAVTARGGRGTGEDVIAPDAHLSEETTVLATAESDTKPGASAEGTVGDKRVRRTRLSSLSMLGSEGRRVVTGAKAGWKHLVAGGLPRIGFPPPVGVAAGTGPDGVKASEAAQDAGSSGKGSRAGGDTVADSGKGSGVAGTPGGSQDTSHKSEAAGGTDGKDGSKGEKSGGRGGEGTADKGQPGANTADGALVPVLIEAYPAPTEIWVDDVRRGMRKVEGLKLTPGIHTLRLHHPTCDACEDTIREFQVDAGQQLVSLKEKIGLKPAEVVVKSGSPGQVFVDSELVGRTNEVLKVRARDHLPWKVALKVLFDDQSLAPYEHACMVVAGRRADVAVPHQ